MCTSKRKLTTHKVVALDKSTTLKEQLQVLVPVPAEKFNQLLVVNEHLLDVRTIGYIDRYYNDYGLLLGVQDGMNHFYVSSTLL